MLIPCPVCGARDVAEFSYEGDAERVIPALDDDTERWNDYLWQRDNPAGPHDSFWRHLHGCGVWMRIRRDTRSHEILQVTLIGSRAGFYPRDQADQPRQAEQEG